MQKRCCATFWKFGIETFVDEKLIKQKEINFNVGRNDKSISIKVNDYLKIQKVKIEDFSCD